MIDKLIINPIGGLANRMRSIASGLSLFKAAECRTCEIVWPINSDLFCRFEELFEPISEDVSVRNVSLLTDLLLYDVPRKKNLYLANLIQYFTCGQDVVKLADCYSEHCGVSVNLNDIRNHKRVIIRSGVIFYDFDNDLYRHLFRPKSDIIKEAYDRIVGDYIGLHIRRTDNVMSIKYSPLELFVKAIDDEILRNRSARFYLATDDAEVKSELSRKYGSIIHYSQGDVGRDTEGGIREALIELVCLSLCKKIYGSYWSSFSEAAAILGNKPLVQLTMGNSVIQEGGE